MRFKNVKRVEYHIVKLMNGEWELWEQVKPSNELTAHRTWRERYDDGQGTFAIVRMDMQLIKPKTRRAS